MLTCPQCDSEIDVEEEDVDEGDTLQCDECGKTLRVVSTDPIEIEASEDDDDEDDEDDEDFDDEEDEDYDESDDEEGSSNDDWR